MASSPESLRVRAHLVQLDIAWDDRSANLARARTLIDAAPVEPGDLIVLPEMFDTGFSTQTEHTIDADGASREFLRETARRHAATVIGGVTVPGPGPRPFNRACLYTPQGDLGAGYDKAFTFPLGGGPQGPGSERERIAAGTALSLADWGDPGTPGGPLRVCPLVCYDLRFPELFRRGLDHGAEVFVVIANWPQDRAAHWRALLVARAIENQAFVLGVNRTGSDPSLRYHGGSIAVTPRGEVIAEADAREQVVTVEIDPGAVRSWRAVFPAWRDRGGVF